MRMVLQDEIKEKEEKKIGVQTCVLECNVSFGVTPSVGSLLLRVYRKLNPEHLITVHWCICPSLVWEPPTFCCSPLGRAVLEDGVSHCCGSHCYLSCTAMCRAAGSHLSCGVCYRMANNPQSLRMLSSISSQHQKCFPV